MMNNKKIFIRQGDIMFESVPERNNNLEPIKSKTVALGEITGHHHSFTENSQVLLNKFDISTDDNPHSVTVFEEKDTLLTHQEHFSIQFPKGEYKIKREQSYNPFLKQIQRSMD